MTSKERILAAWNGAPSDHVPLSTWCFGFESPNSLRWETDGHEIKYWYSMRLEHLHTLPEPWGPEDDFKRVLAWRTLGVDDVLDVSAPLECRSRGYLARLCCLAGQGRRWPGIRDFQEPFITDAVRQTGGMSAGWVIQPDHVPIIEDFNIPRVVEPPVSRPSDIPVIRGNIRPAE